MQSKPHVYFIVQLFTAVYLFAFGVYLMMSNHGDFVLLVNEYHTPFWDVFFKYWTYLGDGVMLGVVALIMLFINYYRFFAFLIAIGFQTVFVHIFKQWLYAGEPRPKTFFADSLDQLNFVEGVVVRGFDSFPSGHTASAFTLGFFLIMICKNKWTQVLILFATILVGISRVYILQHFGRDIFFGAIFGIISVLLGFYLMRNKADSPKLQKGLLKR
ncbi:phosphatase PAP2 family protein [Roseivirga pacifica]